MSQTKLDDLINFMHDMSSRAPEGIVYTNKWLGTNKIEKIIRDTMTGGGKWEYNIKFKEEIDFEKFKKAAKEHSNTVIDFLGDEEVMNVNYGGDTLQPIMTVERKGTIRFHEQRKCFAMSIINGYLKEIDWIFEKEYEK